MVSGIDVTALTGVVGILAQRLVRDEVAIALDREAEGAVVGPACSYWSMAAFAAGSGSFESTCDRPTAASALPTR